MFSAFGRTFPQSGKPPFFNRSRSRHKYTAADLFPKCRANLHCLAEFLFLLLFGIAGTADHVAGLSRLSISGAEGGCQAEVGSASAMSAAALVLAAGGSPFQASQAICFVIKNMLGLICDPVAGLVEVPCVKRNAIGASYAFIAADIALAGIESKIPVDEVINAM